jgi:ABC-type siderophore export system fused ATPase/permease subunit
MPNESLIHADIFFFVSTIALVVLSIGFAIALFYVIKILRDAREISDKIKVESGEIVADSKKLRAALRDEGLKWKHVGHLIRGFFMKDSEKKTRKRATASSKDEAGE